MSIEHDLKGILEFASKNVYLPKVGKYTFTSEDVYLVYLENVDILLDNDLLIRMNNNNIKITALGREIFRDDRVEDYLYSVIRHNDSIKEKETLELEKAKVDLELAKETLKEFPRTKWFARVGFFIAVFLALKELYMLLQPVLFP